MKHTLIRVLSNVEGVTQGCDVAQLAWNDAIRTGLRNRMEAFKQVNDPGLVEMVYGLPTISHLEAPDPSSEINLDETFDEDAFIIVNDSFVNALRPSEAELAGSYLVVFEGGFKWRTYVADSEVILETEELPWGILDSD